MSVNWDKCKETYSSHYPLSAQEEDHLYAQFKDYFCANISGERYLFAHWLDFVIYSEGPGHHWRYINEQIKLSHEEFVTSFPYHEQITNLNAHKGTVSLKEKKSSRTNPSSIGNTSTIGQFISTIQLPRHRPVHQTTTTTTLRKSQNSSSQPKPVSQPLPRNFGNPTPVILVTQELPPSHRPVPSLDRPVTHVNQVQFLVCPDPHRNHQVRFLLPQYPKELRHCHPVGKGNKEL